MTATKQRGVSKAALLARQNRLTGKARQIAAAANEAAQRKAAVEQRRRRIGVVHGVNCICTGCIMEGA